ncbi:MAG: outer membrane protein transport protein [Fusobacterium sp. JB020]|nr:outer membrane protein transport protein [Fusobacterium sp. JB020]
MNLKKLGIISTLLSTTIFGASIDHVQNYTPEYNANPAQQGAINKSATVYFNPAGIMRLEEGTYFTGGLQVAIGQETMKYDSNTYDADLLAPIPNFAIYKVQEDKGYFFTFGPQAGGGKLEYKDGVSGIKVLEDLTLHLPNPSNPDQIIPVTAKANSHSATGENMYAQATLGTAWNVNSKLSLSTAGKVVYGYRKLSGNLNATLTKKQDDTIVAKIPLNASIDSERTAWGFGGQFGLNYAPNETWNIGVRYDTPIKMKFKTKSTSNTTLPGFGFEMFFPQYADGASYRRDLPGILAIGASQKITDKWTMFYGGNYYFNESANIDRDVPEHSFEYKNGWELSLGTEYWINEKVAILSGINYAKTGAKSESYSDIEFALDSFLVGGGIKYLPNEDTEIVFSVSHYFYEEDSYDKYGKLGANPLVYDKNISSVGISFTKKL